MKNNKQLIILGSIVLLCIVVIGVYRKHLHKASDNAVHIGVVLPLTGDLSYFGNAGREGLLCAFDEMTVEEKNYIDFKIVDGKSTSKDCISAYQELSYSGYTDACICLSSVAAKSIVSYNKKGLYLLSMVSDSRVTSMGPTILNFTLNTRQELEVMAEYWKKEKKKSIGLIYQRDDLGEDTLLSMREIAEQYNFSIVSAEGFSTIEEMNNATSVVLSKEPDVFFIGTIGGRAAIVARRLVEKRYGGFRCGYFGFYTPTVLEPAGEASEGVFVCRLKYEDKQDREVDSFKERYRNRFGKNPDVVATYLYALGKMVVSHAKAVSWEAAKLPDSIITSPGFKTIMGDVTRDEQNRCLFQVEVGQIRNGKLVPVAKLEGMP